MKLADGFIYDLKNERLLDNKKVEVKLAKKEIRMFNLFVKNTQKIITYEQIEQYVWEGDLTSNENIRALIKRIRKKLPFDAIDSKSGVGYRLITKE